LYTPVAGAEQVLRQGTLPSQLERNLHEVLTEAALTKQSQVIQPLVCNSYSDGIDVKYVISLSGKDYMLDSCGTSIDGQSKLWTTLGSIWDYYETVGNKS
jgi:hypothetical protein